jgi:hypothetical protein
VAGSTADILARSATGVPSAASSFNLLREYLAGPDELRSFVGEGPILTDDRPLVEYFVSLPRDRNVDLSGLRGDVHRHVIQL